MAWQSVTAAYSNPYEETVYLDIVDAETGARQRIVSNRIHPFFVQIKAANDNQTSVADRRVPRSADGRMYRKPVANGYWIDTADLKPDQRLLNPDGTCAIGQAGRAVAMPLTAWNITAANTEPCFVRGADYENAQSAWARNHKMPFV